MERAILVRHGESVLNARGLASGRADVECPLSERGIEQARELGRALAAEPIDLCVTSALERAQQTADIALDGRGVPRLALPGLNDPLYGCYESGPVDDYVAWALANDSAAEPPGGGEARRAIVARYADAFATLATRPESVVLVVAHSLPIAYVLAALDGRDPAPRVRVVEHGKPHVFTRDELERTVARMSAWCTAPTW